MKELGWCKLPEGHIHKLSFLNSLWINYHIRFPEHRSRRNFVIDGRRDIILLRYQLAALVTRLLLNRLIDIILNNTYILWWLFLIALNGSPRLSSLFLFFDVHFYQAIAASIATWKGTAKCCLLLITYFLLSWLPSLICAVAVFNVRLGSSLATSQGVIPVKVGVTVVANDAQCFVLIRSMII